MVLEAIINHNLLFVIVWRIAPRPFLTRVFLNLSAGPWSRGSGESRILLISAMAFCWIIRFSSSMTWLETCVSMVQDRDLGEDKGLGEEVLLGICWRDFLSFWAYDGVLGKKILVEDLEESRSSPRVVEEPPDWISRRSTMRNLLKRFLKHMMES